MPYMFSYRTSFNTFKTVSWDDVKCCVYSGFWPRCSGLCWANGTGIVGYKETVINRLLISSTSFPIITNAISLRFMVLLGRSVSALALSCVLAKMASMSTHVNEEIYSPLNPFMPRLTCFANVIALRWFQESFKESIVHSPTIYQKMLILCLICFVFKTV